MIESILLKFLDNGLINVGGDDVKFEKLSGTAADLAAVLKTAPERGASFALIAFDPDAPVNDPVVVETMDILKKRWATYANTFHGVPLAVVRAMLLEALMQAAAENEKVAVVFAACARNVLPYMEVGNERSIWVDLIAKVERSVDARAEAEWATPGTIQVDKLRLAKPPAVNAKFTTGEVAKEVLLKRVFAAAGPTKADGSSSGESPNPHWPNSAQQWSHNFAPRLTDTLKDTIDAVAKTGKVEAIDFSAPLEQFATEVSAYATQLLAAFGGATAGLQRRTNLLWWKEALFSPSAQISYRSQTRTIAAATMAFDLYQQLPTLSPSSVAAFLQEAVRSLPKEHDKPTHLLRDLFEEARTHIALGELRRAAADLMPNSKGRGFLLSLIGHSESHAPISDSRFKELVGIPSDTSLGLPEWSVWLFRELQAARATHEVDNGKKKVRKGEEKK